MGASQLTFSANGKRLVAVGYATLTTISTALCVHALNLSCFNGCFRCVCRSKLVSFDFVTGKRMCKFDAHTTEAACLAAFPDGVRTPDTLVRVYLSFSVLLVYMASQAHVVSSASDRFVTVWKLPKAAPESDDEDEEEGAAAPEPPKVLVCPSKYVG